MADLIDRQAAIDALDSINCCGWVEDSWAKVSGIIEHVPSAQPEIVRCGECKYNPNNPRPYADNDPIETFIHCQFMEANDFCSKGKAITEEER